MAETALAARRAAPRVRSSARRLCLGSWAAFSLQDAIVKSLVVDLPVPEVLFGRSLVIVALIVAVPGPRADYRALSEPRQPAARSSLRSALILLAWLAYYRASRSLQLAELVTYYFVAPLFVVGAVGAAAEGARRARAAGWRRLLGFARRAGRGGARRRRAARAGGAGAARRVRLGADHDLLARSLAKGVITPAMMLAGSIGFLAACGADVPVDRRHGRPSGSAGDGGARLRRRRSGSISGSRACGAPRPRCSRRSNIRMLAYAIFWGYVLFGDLAARAHAYRRGDRARQRPLVMGLEMRRAPRSDEGDSLARASRFTSSAPSPRLTRGGLTWTRVRPRPTRSTISFLSSPAPEAREARARLSAKYGDCRPRRPTSSSRSAATA